MPENASVSKDLGKEHDRAIRTLAARSCANMRKVFFGASAQKMFFRANTRNAYLYIMYSYILYISHILSFLFILYGIRERYIYFFFIRVYSYIYGFTFIYLFTTAYETIYSNQSVQSIESIQSTYILYLSYLYNMV